jgi:hypothetical protein
MVAKEKMLIFIATIIVIFIFVALVLPGFSDMLPLENPLLQGKDAFVRYYACSLAICTRGCGWFSSNNDICLKRNIWGNCTMTCKTEICDKKPNFGNCGNKGMCCNDTYSIYVSLKGNAKFWSKYEYIPPMNPSPMPRYASLFPIVYAQGGALLSAETEIDKIMEKFSNNEKKPGFPVNIMSGGNCQLSPARYFSEIHPYGISILKQYGLFYKMEKDNPSQIIDWSQTGAIYMLPDQAEPQFTCMGYDTDFGYSECTFKGYLQIYSWDPNNDNCADVVVINGEEPFTGEFWIYAANDGNAKIPIDHTSAIPLYILNGLGFTSSFTMQIVNPLPAGITCDFNGQDRAKVDGLQDTKVGTPDVPLTCKPTALPPPSSGGFEIWIKAWDGTKTNAVKLTIDVGDFNLKLVSSSPLIINAGNIGSFTFNLTNNIGRDVTFQLARAQRLAGTQSIDNNVGCTFNGGITSIDVADYATKQITLTCVPNLNAKNKNYEIDVTAKYDTVERTAVAKVNVPNCSVSNLAVEFLDSTGTRTTTVESGDAVTLKAYGFSGCQNMNVSFMLSLGTKLIKETEIGTDGNLVYYPPNSLDFLTANSPDKWEMYVQIDENGDGIFEKESSRKNLTINTPGPAGYGGKDNPQKCGYAMGEASCCAFYSTSICDQCGGCIPIFDWHPVDDCTHCLDPQSCFNTQGYYSSASNICCGKGLSTYNPGLTDAPCLSPDTITTNDQPSNSNIQWREVDDPRDVLVYEPNPATDSQAVFKRPDCGSDAECKDTLGLIDAECGNFDSDTHHSGKECKIKGFPDTDWYTSWMLIKISDESRPVYGIQIIPQDNLQGFYFGSVPYPPWIADNTQMNFTVFRHVKSGNWFKVKEIFYSGYSPPGCPPGKNCPVEYVFNLKPDGTWSWENTDALLIGYKYGKHTHYYVSSPGHYSWDTTDADGKIDYVGLLTKSNDNITYCTDGPGGTSPPSTYRTVDNGKICYWGVNCDEDNGDGWTFATATKVIGPFKDISYCSCETDNCGDGVCGPFNLNGQNYRFDNVTCIYGGWMGNLVKS